MVGLHEELGQIRAHHLLVHNRPGRLVDHPALVDHEELLEVALGADDEHELGLVALVESHAPNAEGLHLLLHRLNNIKTFCIGYLLSQLFYHFVLALGDSVAQDHDVLGTGVFRTVLVQRLQSPGDTIRQLANVHGLTTGLLVEVVADKSVRILGEVADELQNKKPIDSP